MFAAIAADPKPMYFNIRAQSMDAALIEFSEQANSQLMIASELVEDLRSMGVRGRFLPADALKALIAETGLTLHSIREKAIAIVRDDAS